MPSPCQGEGAGGGTCRDRLFATRPEAVTHTVIAAKARIQAVMWLGFLDAGVRGCYGYARAD